MTIKDLLNQKKMAFQNGDGERRRNVQQELYMLHWAYAYLDVPGSYVRIMFFDFSSAFNTIQPPILKDKLLGMGVAPSLTSWIID